MANKEDDNPTRENGVTSLHLAARYGNFELCKLLLDNRSDKNPRTVDGWKPLHEAASSGHLKICSLFITNVPDDINTGNLVVLCHEKKLNLCENLCFYPY